MQRLGSPGQALRPFTPIDERNSMVSRHWHARHALPSIPRFPASALALAIGCALAGPPAQAAEPAARAASRGYAIAGGKLGDVLAEFAALSGVQLVFDPQTLAGRGSHGLQGAYGVREGFVRLLDGSGYEAVESGPGRYSLRAVPPPPAAPAPAAGDGAAREATLPAVRVAAMADARDGTTEHTGSYTTSSSRTATKLDLSLRETPQTVTVVTRQKMDDFGLTNVAEVLENSGTISITRAGNNGNVYYSRGFMLQSQYDGLPNPVGIGESNRGPVPDTAFLDKVEILQGASGLMAGAGEPGGTINVVRKRPTRDFQAHVETQLGSWNKRRLAGDVSGSLAEAGRVRGRAVAFADNSDSFTDYVYYNNRGLYGVVEADLTDTTMLGASVMYQQTDFNDHYGVPFAANGTDLGLPRSRFYGASRSDGRRDGTSYTLRLEQKLPADWSFKTAFTHEDANGDKVLSFLSGTLDAVSGDGLSVAAQRGQRKISSNVLDFYASGPFQWLGRAHELVLGGTVAKLKVNNINWAHARTPINIYDFDASAIPRPSGTAPAWSPDNTTDQSGLYGAVRLNLADPLKLILGTRVSWYEYKAAGTRTQKETAVVSPYAGLLYDLNAHYTAYASYSDIFKPQSNLTAGGGTVEPVVGKNYEAGIKGEFLNGRLNASAAVFRLEQTHLAQTDYSAGPAACGGGYCYTAAGLVVSQGIDLGLNGELAPGWQVGAGYTYVNSEYGNGAQKGSPYSAYLPQHVLQAHTTYRLPATAWAVGGSLRGQNKTYADGATSHTQQGGFAVVGLLAKYQINRQAELGLVVNNLFDRRYYSAVANSTSLGNFYGAPRSFAANLRYRF